MRALAVAAIVFGGCAPGGPQQIGTQPSWRSSAAVRTSAAIGPVRFAPAGAAVRRYNEPVVPPPPSPLNDAVTAAVHDAARRAGLALPVADRRLFRACAELAEIVPEEGVVNYSLVEFALQRNGIIEPSPHLLVVRGELGSPALIVEQLQPRFAEMLDDGASLRLGVGAARRYPDGTGVVVFALQATGVTTAPIPRELPAGGSLLIDAVVDPRFRDPELFVTRDDGATERLKLGPGRPGGFTAQVGCGSRTGRQQVEITASDASGSTVLANFPVWCAAPPPDAVTIDPVRHDADIATPEAAERRLFASVNRARLAAGIPALVLDDRVSQVARAHAEEMRRTRVVAHVSPTTGSAADRVRAAQIKTGLVLENVARAYGIDEAHEGLMNSPGHRANVMLPQATHVGIGVAFGEEVSGRREMFVAQVFTRVPPALDVRVAIETVRKKLVTAQPGIAAAPQLRGVAQQFADLLAAGKDRDDAYNRIKGQLDGMGKLYQRVATVITATADLDTLDPASLLGGAAIADVGIGVAQGTHPELGERAIWVIVLIGERR